MGTTMITDLSLLRLLQLSSVSLPVGGYAFSQGLEYAIDCGWVRKAEHVESWLSEQLLFSVARTDLPVLLGVMAADDKQSLTQWNDLILACRETKELRLTDTAMGEAMIRLLTSLDVPIGLPKKEPASFVVLFGVAARYWRIPYQKAALGFAWSWLENQVAAATKLVPLGQTQAQQLLGTLQPLLPEAIAIAATVSEENIGSGLPALAIASAKHENQYSRLFRS